uniref:Uncharacterized protein n=1 Tax=Florenciella sp. virus SA2 TaxID=3240092 RepID=A0AB39JEN0_9VIRU
MAFTRFHDDYNRILKTNLETSAKNEYIFNVPNNFNNKNIYLDDPHIRLQKLGNPQFVNMVDAESELKTLTLKNMRDYVKNQYPKTELNYNKVPVYNVSKDITNESRSSHPAWSYRSMQQYRPEYLFHDPQKNTTMKFENNVDSNLLLKDNYTNVHKKI